jgi:hypothetical protein
MAEVGSNKGVLYPLGSKVKVEVKPEHILQSSVYSTALIIHHSDHSSSSPSPFS